MVGEIKTIEERKQSLLKKGKENGYVTYPNVNIITEMTNLIDASRSYEANATAFNASKTIATKGLEMAQ